MACTVGKKRLRGIAIRQELTDEWKDREIKESIEYAILINEISKISFFHININSINVLKFNR
jgi:hypothetical protein